MWGEIEDVSSEVKSRNEEERDVCACVRTWSTVVSAVTVPIFLSSHPETGDAILPALNALSTCIWGSPFGGVSLPALHLQPVHNMNRTYLDVRDDAHHHVLLPLRAAHHRQRVQRVLAVGWGGRSQLSISHYIPPHPASTKSTS